MISLLEKILAPFLKPMGVSSADLHSYLTAVKGYIYLIVIALVVMIAVLITAHFIKKGWKAFVRIQAVLAFLLVIVVSVNAICYGPLYNNVSGFLNASKVVLADDTVSQSLDTVKKIAEEGMVLLKNDGTLPLGSDKAKLNVFGWDSVNPLLGGTGSSSSNAAAATDILTSLKDAGYETNNDLTQMYKNYRKDRPVLDMQKQDLTLPEPTMDYYTDDIINNAKNFSDTAVIVIGRPGGENYDLPTDMYSVIHGTYNVAKDVSSAPDNYNYLNASYTNNGDYDDFDKGDHYLQLSNTEEKLVDLVCSNFKKVIVVINSTNTMELNWVDKYKQISAVLLAPAPGANGFKALGEILKGTVNPSGRTADTFAKDLLKTPYINNIGNFNYKNVNMMTKSLAKDDGAYQGTMAFLHYVEGIYVGYRFYETAAEEGLINYEDAVQYPFGYGLSYTTFDQSIEDFKASKDSVSFKVKVTNTGKVAGKDAVEVYFTPPYTNGGIEKASVNLIDFGKTKMLEPGASEEVEFTINNEDLASYDSDGIKVKGGGYILEAGEYAISIRSDSHTSIDEKKFTVKNDISYNETSKSTDKVPATNHFQDYSRGDFTQLSRADGFANYNEAIAAPKDSAYEMKDDTKAAVKAITVSDYDSSAYDKDSDKMPVTNADNGLKLSDMAGASYEDKNWDKLLDEMSIKEMNDLINVGGWQTAAVDSIGKIATSDCDGPAGLSNYITGANGTTYPSEVLMAQTWSKDIAVEIGTSMGSEFAAAKNYGWYGPAMNIHRSAFAGRNFEYYSEDPLLSAYIAAGETQGAAQFGVYPYIKHFALNDQETNRCAILLEYASEQAIREIYLKPFEKVVKEYQGKNLAVMSSYVWIGDKPCYANSNLLNSVLRDEWGFQGMVETDYDGSYGYMITDNAIRNGGDLMLGYGSFDSNKLNSESATVVIAMRRACKNILYTIVNSGYYSEGSPIPTENKMDKLFRNINIGAGIIFVAIEALMIALLLKRRKSKTVIIVDKE
ncbi:beta-glucosidase [Anaerocolumna chitinilytica]|uniref:Beta-glucosidase n=1 Tax=Anaerocolumna chitinilytica TaxID=1727145 RepID=A0A7I8DGF8_9FIRM|nr:glycoside hydrolase family 3 C-terminal domain-containing protein [Anaerocolumna chitinilytica]BCJ97598.1 beta-glucosidase [Anaerocolumna chitinilytica]